MRRSLYLCLSTCLVTITSLWAQGTFVSTPSYATAEGGGAAFLFGHYANGHYQLCEGEMRGMKLSLTEVAFRLDHRNHSASTTMKRKWTQVTLSLADTDWTQFTSTFTKNQFTTPVQVFNGAVAWPGFLGTPFAKPAAFDHKFPFKSPYNYSGARDLLQDFIFFGGTLDNNAAWSGSTSQSYYLDGDNTAPTYSSPQTYYPSAQPNPRCRDSAISSNVSAYTYASLQVHGITHSTTAYRDKVQFQLYSYYTAPNARIITAIAFGGAPAGVNVGARCNLLYASLNGPWLALGRTTSGSSAYSGNFTAFAPWSTAMANLPVWVQTAWDDSSLNIFSLTRAMRVVMPANTPYPPRKVNTYYFDATSANGYGPNINNVAYNPISRFTYK